MPPPKKTHQKWYLQGWEEESIPIFIKVKCYGNWFFLFEHVILLTVLFACPGRRLNVWEHGKSWLSRLTTINHLTLHLELVCTRYVKSKEPHSHAGLTASNIFPSHLLCSLLFKSKSGDRIGLAEWVAAVENKLCVGSHPAKFMWNCLF